MSAQFSIRAHYRYLLGADIPGFLLCVLVLFAVSRLPSLLSTLAFVLLTAGCAAGFGADIALWFLRGVRAVEVDDESMTVYRGRSLASLRMDRRRVQRLRIVRRLGRRTVVLHPAAGPALRISDDAFPREEFARLLDIISTWRK